jgi:O-antigen/teichoic acid export membrane protein
VLKKSTIKESGILFIASIIGGFSNYLYNIIIGRLLGPVNYAEVTSLFSVIVIASVPSGTIQTVITKFTAKYNAHNEHGKIQKLLKGAAGRLLIAGLIFYLIFILFSRLISDFMKIESILPVILLGLILIPSAVIPVYRGALQGMQKYLEYSVSGTLEILGKFIFGVALVYFGFKTSGAVLGLSLAGICALIFTRMQLRGVLNQKITGEAQENIIFKELFKYSKNVILNILCFTVLTSSTMILVKHYFLPEQAGMYAGAEIISKIVLFLTGVIPVMIFPKAAALHAKNIDSRRILLKSTAVVFGIGVLFILCSIFFGNFIVTALFGEKYSGSASLLGPLSIVMTLYSLYNIMSVYQLSISNFKFIYGTIILTAVQIGLIVGFHNTLKQVVFIMLGSSILIVLYNLYCSLSGEKKNNAVL